jgi:hypothetical protein
MLLKRGRPAGTVQAIAGVAEPEHDAGVRIELVVDRRRENRYVGVRGLKHAYAFRRRQQQDQADACAGAGFDALDRGDGGIAGRQHRIDEHAAAGSIGGRLEEVVDRVHRRRVAVETRTCDPREGHEIGHALGHAEAGAQDRGETGVGIVQRRAGKRPSGVSILTSRQDRSRVASSYSRSMPTSRIRRRNSGCMVSRCRKRVSLCCTMESRANRRNHRPLSVERHRYCALMDAKYRRFAGDVQQQRRGQRGCHRRMNEILCWC